MAKLEIDLDKMTQKQRTKLDRTLRKHCPFKAVKWIDEE